MMVSVLYKSENSGIINHKYQINIIAELIQASTIFEKLHKS